MALQTHFITRKAGLRETPTTFFLLSRTGHLLCGHNTHCTIHPTLRVNPVYFPSILSALIRTSQASHQLLSTQPLHVWTSTNSLYPTPSNSSATDTHSTVNNSTPIPEPNPYTNRYPMMRCTCQAVEGTRRTASVLYIIGMYNSHIPNQSTNLSETTRSSKRSVTKTNHRNLTSEIDDVSLHSLASSEQRGHIRQEAPHRAGEGRTSGRV